MITYGKLIENAKKKINLNNLEHRAIYMFLEDILNVDRARLLLMKEEIVDDNVLEKFSEMLSDYIIDYKPIEYILGYTYFYGNKIKVNDNVLIPRDETEELVEQALKYIDDGDKVLDLCTGSGAIAISIKKEKEMAEVFASDVSKEALATSEENARYNNVKISFYEGDLLTPFKGKEKFDVIVCNPPYISKLFEINDVVAHEPSIALFADNNGLLNYEKVMKDLPEVLKNDGVALFEIGFDQKDSVKEICNKYLKEYSFECIKDINDKDRIVIIKLK